MQHSFYTVKTISTLCCLLVGTTLSAQLVITPGAQLTLRGNAQVTLQNADLVNNGTLDAGAGTFAFTGNGNSNVSGSNALLLYRLEIAKTGGAALLLQRQITVANNVVFTSGLINLNGYNLDLGLTGSLAGESESSRVTGSNGGHILYTTTLSAPVAVDPGNLGAVITSSQNLGTVQIRRGHQSQTNASGGGASILRYYDIIPANNTGLNATLRFNYLNAELNGLTQSSLVLWRSQNNVSWTVLGAGSSGTNPSFVEQSGIGTMARFTLSSAGNPLPVTFLGWNVQCQQDGSVLLTWKTAAEQGSSHFVVEAGPDGRAWALAGTLPAAGTSNTEKNYRFTHRPAANGGGYYRLAQYDLNGRVAYSPVLRSPCTPASNLFTYWPNPFTNDFFMRMSVNAATDAVIKVWDAKGAVVKVQRAALSTGVNTVGVNLQPAAAGTYRVTVESATGAALQTFTLVKQ